MAGKWITNIKDLWDRLTATRAGYLDELAAANLPADIDSLLARITAARGGYLDELAAANLPADIAILLASGARQLFTLEEWSIPQIAVVIPGGAATQTLPDVVVSDLPAGATVVKAKCFFKFISRDNAGAANKLSGAQHIGVQKNGAGGFTDCISMVDDQYKIAAATVDAPGDVLMGDHDVAAKIDGNGTYNFQWTSALADVAGLTFKDLQMGIRIWYSI